jgi:hypothetical protein
MAATGFTPIQLYHSTTNNAVPLAGSLAFGELAVNVFNGKLYYKNSNTGLVSILADAASATGNLPGGAAGSLVFQSAPGVTTYLPIGTSSFILTSSGTGPVYTNPSAITVGTAASATFATTAGSATSATTATTSTNIAGGTAGQLVFQSAAGVTAFAVAPTGADVGRVLSWNGSSFTWVAAPAATSATNIAGGAQYQIPFQSGVGATTFSANLTFDSSTNTIGTTNITATGAVGGATVTATNALTGNTVVGLGSTFTSSTNAGVHSFGTLSYSDINIGSSTSGTSNNYIQNIIQNKSNGATASADYIVSNDLGTASTYYGDFGMNSSTHTGVGPFQLPNAVYLYATDSDLVVGTKTAHALRFVTSDNAADSMTINATGAVAFNGNFGTANQILTSTGSITAPIWVTPSAIVIGTATNLAGGTGGVVPYQSATNTTAFTSVGTAGQYLQSNGTGAPTWTTLVIADNSLLWYFMG